MKLRGVVLLSMGLLAAPLAQAFEIKGVPIYATINTSAGYSTSSVSDLYSHPFLLQFGLGGTAAYSLQDRWLFGLSTHFSFINQYSDETVTGSGANYAGHRWTIVTPTLGYRTNGFTFLIDPEFLGAYSLKVQSIRGSDISFKSPLGAKVRAMYGIGNLINPALSHLNGGLMFEYVRFNTLSDSKTGDTSLTNSQKLWQLGLAVEYEF
jgi:hypothetical protein